MKLTIPGMLIVALFTVSPVAFAQNMNTGNASAPGASVNKDDSGMMTKTKMKHTASNKHHHSSKAMNSKAQMPGPGTTSAPGASVNKQ